jgi:hypothetical protein
MWRKDNEPVLPGQQRQDVRRRRTAENFDQQLSRNPAGVKGGNSIYYAAENGIARRCRKPVGRANAGAEPDPGTSPRGRPTVFSRDLRCAIPETSVGMFKNLNLSPAMVRCDCSLTDRSAMKRGVNHTGGYLHTLHPLNRGFHEPSTRRRGMMSRSVVPAIIESAKKRG